MVRPERVGFPCWAWSCRVLEPEVCCGPQLTNEAPRILEYLRAVPPVNPQEFLSPEESHRRATLPTQYPGRVHYVMVTKDPDIRAGALSAGVDMRRGVALTALSVH